MTGWAGVRGEWGGGGAWVVRWSDRVERRRSVTYTYYEMLRSATTPPRVSLNDGEGSFNCLQH